VWAFLVPLVLDSAAFYAAALALRSVLAGDSALGDRLLVWLYALGSAALNVWHADRAGGLAAALFYGGASVSAVVLWDRTLHATRRDALRELGAIDPPAPRFRAMRWVIRPRETWRAWSLAIAEGVSIPAEALALAREARSVAPASPAADPLRADVERIDGPADASPAADVAGLSKADAVRLAWSELGKDAPAGEVVAWLGNRGVAVKDHYPHDVARRDAQKAAHVAESSPALSVVGAESLFSKGVRR
jgi:hypothetical protein